MSGNPRGSLGALLFGDWGRSQKKNISVKNSVGCGWFFTRLKNTWFCQKVMQSQESVWEMVWLFCGGIVWNDWKNCLIERSLVFFFLIVSSVMKKLRHVTIYFGFAHLHKLFGCEHHSGMILGYPINLIILMRWKLPFRNYQPLNFDSLCIACWMIWNWINKLIFENKIPSSMDLWSWIAPSI